MARFTKKKPKSVRVSITLAANSLDDAALLLMEMPVFVRDGYLGSTLKNRSATLTWTMEVAERASDGKVGG